MAVNTSFWGYQYWGNSGEEFGFDTDADENKAWVDDFTDREANNNLVDIARSFYINDLYSKMGDTKQWDKSISMYGIPDHFPINHFYLEKHPYWTESSGSNTIYQSKQWDWYDSNDEEQTQKRNSSLSFFDHPLRTSDPYFTFTPEKLDLHTSISKFNFLYAREGYYSDFPYPVSHNDGGNWIQGCNTYWFQAGMTHYEIVPTCDVFKYDRVNHTLTIHGNELTLQQVLELRTEEKNAETADSESGGHVPKTYDYLVTNVRIKQIIRYTKGANQHSASLIYKGKNSRNIDINNSILINTAPEVANTYGVQRIGTLNTLWTNDSIDTGGSSFGVGKRFDWNNEVGTEVRVIGYYNDWMYQDAPIILTGKFEDIGNTGETIGTKVTGAILVGKHCPMSVSPNTYLGDLSADEDSKVKYLYFKPSDLTQFGWIVKMKKYRTDFQATKLEIGSHVCGIDLFLKLLTTFGTKALLTSKADTDAVTEEDYIYPIIDGNGYVTGEWSNTPTEASSKNNYEEKTPVSEDGPGNGGGGGGGGGGDTPDDDGPGGGLDNDGSFHGNNPYYNGYSFGNKAYILTKTEVDLFTDWLWTADEFKGEELKENLDLMGANPIDAVLSLRLYPFDINGISSLSKVNERIVLGRVGSERAGIPLVPTITGGSVEIPLGSFNIKDKLPDSVKNNFLYKMCHANLFIPYCGDVALDMSDIYGHKVTVTLKVDLIDGSCMGTVFLTDSEVPYITVTGKIGIDIPITSTFNSSATISSAIGLASNAASIVTGAIGGGVLGAVGGALNTVGAAASIYANKNASNFQTKGNYSSNLYSQCPQNLILTILYPNLAPEYDANTYAKTKGHACNKTATLSSMSGFTVCDNVDMSGINAPEFLKDEAKKILESGVYL